LQTAGVECECPHGDGEDHRDVECPGRPEASLGAPREGLHR
jgi:hypothetical protein